MKFLCDTSVFGELVKRRPNAKIVDWASRQTQISLSTLTLEEIVFGLSGDPGSEVNNWLDRFLDKHCEVLPVSEDIACRAGELRAQMRNQGKVCTQTDMLIASTALEHGLTLVTRYEEGFNGCGVTIFNPFI